MIAHILSVRRRPSAAEPGRHIDTILVYCRGSNDSSSNDWASPRAQVLTLFMVDTKFFVPEPLSSNDDAMICSAGLELRDADTLTEAVHDPGRPRCRQPLVEAADLTQDRALPANVEVCRLDLIALPLTPCPLRRGAVRYAVPGRVTTILEAMAMGKAVVCSRTTGQTDGRRWSQRCPRRPATSICAAIVDLLAELTAGALGRGSYAEGQADIDVYVDRLTSVVRATLARRSNVKTMRKQ